MSHLHECRRRSEDRSPRAQRQRESGHPNRTAFAGFPLSRRFARCLPPSRSPNVERPSQGREHWTTDRSIVSDEDELSAWSRIPHGRNYSPCGQLYEPADKENFPVYRESTDGQILRRGIPRQGPLILDPAEHRTATRNPMVPFTYILRFWIPASRGSDLGWGRFGAQGSCSVLQQGAHLSGEGLKPKMVAATSCLTVPNCRLCPCFAYEIALILDMA